MITISLPDFAEDDNIWLIRMLKFLAETNRHLMPDENLISVVCRYVDECVMVIQKGETIER